MDTVAHYITPSLKYETGVASLKYEVWERADNPFVKVRSTEPSARWEKEESEKSAARRRAAKKTHSKRIVKRKIKIKSQVKNVIT